MAGSLLVGDGGVGMRAEAKVSIARSRVSFSASVVATALQAAGSERNALLWAATRAGATARGSVEPGRSILGRGEGALSM